MTTNFFTDGVFNWAKAYEVMSATPEELLQSVNKAVGADDLNTERDEEFLNEFKNDCISSFVFEVENSEYGEQLAPLCQPENNHKITVRHIEKCPMLYAFISEEKKLDPAFYGPFIDGVIDQNPYKADLARVFPFALRDDPTFGLSLIEACTTRIMTPEICDDSDARLSFRLYEDVFFSPRLEKLLADNEHNGRVLFIDAENRKLNKALEFVEKVEQAAEKPKFKSKI